MKNLMVFLLLMVLSGCGFVIQNFDQAERKSLTYGMSKEEVVAKIGQPQKVSKMVIDDRQYDVWEYPNNSRAKIERMNALGIIYSEVLFFNGKLVQRDKNRVYGQPGYQFLESVDLEGGVKPVKIAEQKNNLK